VDIAHDITFHYISRLRYHADELGLVVQGHLLIEFILNEMIRRGFRKPTNILNDHRSYTFAVKAQILYSAGQLPEHIFRNIRRINLIRNHLAHKLDWNSLVFDYKFSRDDSAGRGEIDVRDAKTRRKPTARKYIKLLCLGTLVDLRNYFFATYGIFPAPAQHTRHITATGR
jgi:hypothetical protein